MKDILTVREAAEKILKWIPAHDETTEDEPMYLKSDVIKAMVQMGDVVRLLDKERNTH